MIIVLTAIAVSTFAQSRVSLAKYKGDRQAAVSYTFDDGLLDQYTLLFPVLQELGLKCSFCVNGNTINRYERILATGDTTDALVVEKPRMTWAMIREMSDAGQEMTSHGWAHTNVTKIDGEELRFELEHNDTVIYEHTGIFPRTFFYPGNAKNDEKVSYCEQGRVGTRTRQISIGSKRDSIWLHQWLYELIDKREWGIGMTHGIATGYDHFSDPQILFDHLREAATMQDRIWIDTFHNISAYVKERDAVTILEKTKGRTIVLTPHNPLNHVLFNYPLTLTVKGSIQKATQDGKTLPTTHLNGKTLLDINPNGGKIRIKLKK